MGGQFILDDWRIQEPLDNARINWDLLATAPNKDAVRFYVRMGNEIAYLPNGLPSLQTT